MVAPCADPRPAPIPPRTDRSRRRGDPILRDSAERIHSSRWLDGVSERPTAWANAVYGSRLRNTAHTGCGRGWPRSASATITAEARVVATSLVPGLAMKVRSPGRLARSPRSGGSRRCRRLRGDTPAVRPVPGASKRNHPGLLVTNAESAHGVSVASTKLTPRGIAGRARGNIEGGPGDRGVEPEGAVSSVRATRTRWLGLRTVSEMTCAPIRTDRPAWPSCRREHAHVAADSEAQRPPCAAMIERRRDLRGGRSGAAAEPRAAPASPRRRDEVGRACNRCRATRPEAPNRDARIRLDAVDERGAAGRRCELPLQRDDARAATHDLLERLAARLIRERHDLSVDAPLRSVRAGSNSAASTMHAATLRHVSAYPSSVIWSLCENRPIND